MPLVVMSAKCATISKALIGSQPDTLVYRAYPNSTSVTNGSMVFSCSVYTVDEGLRLPGGTVMGLGSKKPALVRAA